MTDKQALLKALPSVDQLLKSDSLQGDMRDHPKAFVLKAVRQTVDHYRRGILEGSIDRLDEKDLVTEIKKRIKEISTPHLRPLVNATGIVVHTNLGRSPLPKGVLENVRAIAEGYSNLEYDLHTGKRGKRYSHIKELIREITGAEDCLVVNNNAAAVLLCLAALAKGREVIVSRGELIEIGGAFRIPEVMEQSGAVLREVGATNKTHLHDYERAVNENTGLLLKAHRSNFRMIGFTEEVSLKELVALGRKYNLPSMYDLGSGCLVDLKPLGIYDEPMVQEVVDSGMDITTFSGDKLLGGPQAGIIVGRAALIQEIQKYPLTRALRVDKFTLASLESIFMLYADPEGAKNKIPTLKMLFASEESIKIRARRLASALKKEDLPLDITMKKDSSQAGGGSLPEAGFVSWAVSITPRSMTVNELEEGLRKGRIPVIGRIKDDHFILDARTIRAAQIKQIASAMAELFGN